MQANNMEFIKPKILTSYLAKNRGTLSLLKIISLVRIYHICLTRFTA